MSTETATVPTITNAGNVAAKPRKLFVNIPVNDIQRSIIFFEALGFTFSRHFTDATATSMIVGADAYFMLLTHEKYNSFSKRPHGDPKKETNALYTISVDSRAEVDEMVKAAVAAGGSEAEDPATDHGFMYDWGFYDLDGYAWGVFWMDPSVIPA
jgi:predicted lactoylglutathione lyase